MGKKNKNRSGSQAASSGSWQDSSAGGFNSPFAALLKKSSEGASEASVGSVASKANVSKGPGKGKVKTAAQKVTKKAASDKPPKKAVVRMEKKGRGGKRVTVITHLDLSPEQLEIWCKELRTTMGCGGSVEFAKIILQGDQRERAVQALTKKGVKKVTRG